MNEFDMHVERLSEENGSGIPLVCIHGFLGSSRDWHFLRSRLANPVMAVDLPGHGASGLPDGTGSMFDAIADVLIEKLNDAGISRCHLAGYSLGGRVAMHVAHRHPDAVQKMVLESCHPGLEEPFLREARRRNDRRWADRFESDWPSVLDDWYEQDVFASVSNPDPLIQLRSHNDPHSVSRALMGLSLSEQSPMWISDHETLFLAGEFDPKYSDVGRQFASRNETVLCKVVSGCGHNIHMEQAKTYLQLITSFLEIELK